MALKNILIIGTGGTIAGLAPDPSQDPLNYAAGQVGIAEILKNSLSSSLLDQIAVHSVQLANIQSGDLSERLLSQLGELVCRSITDPLYDGVVITHGTDTMEETGMFLHLVASDLAHQYGKGVILTGAMLPSNAPDADGPQNLSLAIEFAAFLGQTMEPSYQFPGGIYGSFAGKVIRAKDYVKRSSNRINAPVMESLDIRAIAPETMQQAATFALSYPDQNTQWPWVEILTNHAGARPVVLNFLLDQGVDGIVFAGTGQGNIHENLMEGVFQAKQKGVPMIRSTRTLLGEIRPEVPVSDRLLGTVAARNLSPAKARIALQLFLQDRKVRKELDLDQLFATI